MYLLSLRNPSGKTASDESGISVDSEGGDKRAGLGEGNGDLGLTDVISREESEKVVYDSPNPKAYRGSRLYCVRH